MAVSVATEDEYEIVNHAEASLDPSQVAQIRSWLDPTEYLAESGEFRRHLSSVAPNTGLWICETEEYQRWHDSPDHGSLWIKGVPGAGKSVVAASIIQHLKSTEDAPVLFFFFRNIVSANFSPRSLIQDWLAQLLPHSPKLQFALKPKIDSDLTEVSENDLIQLFLDGISCVPRLYCVADALDEMTLDNKPFLRKLNSLATHRPKSLKLLMTSRPKQYLQSELKDSSIVHVSLQEQLVNRDILLYLEHRLEQVSKAQTEFRLEQEFVEKVAGRSQGLFLYAKLITDQIEHALQSPEKFDHDTILASLPTGLEETYEDILKKHRQPPSVTVDLQVIVLEAITHAARPLRLSEMASLLQCIQPRVSTSTSGFKQLISQSCGPLIEILEDETLQVIHHSFTEFLRGETRSGTSTDTTRFPVINTKQAHRRLALSCLQYLGSGSLLLPHEAENESCRDPSITYCTPQHRFDYDKAGQRDEKENIRDTFDYREARLRHPFLNYSVEKWSYHASFYDVVDETFFHEILDFIRPDQLDFRRWLSLQWGSTSLNRNGSEGIPTGLHIASFTGLRFLAKKLLAEHHSVSDLDAQLRTPLHWAARSGHASLASLLIEHGADANAVDGRGLKPIHLAASRNQAAVLTVLLEAGVEPTTPKTKENHAGRLLGGERITRGECAVFYVSELGHTEAAIALIPHCNEEALTKMLCESCDFSRSDTVLAILDSSMISPDVMYNEASPLFYACGSCNPICVEALIKRGADVNKMSTWNPRPRMLGMGRNKQKAASPLHRLVKAWSGKTHAACNRILGMLLQAGVDINGVNGDGKTAIQLSTGSRYQHDGLHRQAMQALIKAGADTRQVDSDGQNLLHLVLGTRRDPLAVRLLIEHGLEPNQKDMRGQTALHAAMSQSGMTQGTENTEVIVEYLLKNGADPTVKDKYKVTPIQQAMSISPRLFRLLFDMCKDKDTTRYCWFKLQDMRDNDTVQEYLDMFLVAGVDIESKDSNGCTLYLRCPWNSTLRCALEDRGARIDSVDNKGNNLIHLIFKNSNRDIRKMVEQFVEKGINPLAKNNNGDTLLHHVACWYRGEGPSASLVRWLIKDLGVPANAANNQGSTALHIFQEKNSGSGTEDHRVRTHFIDALSSGEPLDLNVADNDGFAVLHLASVRSESETVVLVDQGANIAILTRDGQNAIHLACRARQANVVGYLLDQTEDTLINQRDVYGRTPLHYACSSGHPDLVDLLLRYGADVHATDKNGCTPLHACAEIQLESQIWATRNSQGTRMHGPSEDRLRPGSPLFVNPGAPWYTARSGVGPSERYSQDFPANVGPIVEMLVDAGARISTLDSRENTILDLALTYDYSDLVQFFKLNRQHLAEATKPTKDPKDDHSAIVQTRRNTQISLTSLKARLVSRDIDESAFNEVVSKPVGYLNFLTADDIVSIVDAGLQNESLRREYYDVLKHIMKQGFVHVLKRSQKLVECFISEESLGLLLRSERYDKTVLNSLQLACKRHDPNLRMISLLLEKFKVDPNACCRARNEYDSQTSGKAGGTAVHTLASGDHWWQKSALEFLISKGADVNAVDEEGRTPLHVSAAGPYFDRMGKQKGFWRMQITKTLLGSGADPNILDANGEAPLHKASCCPEIMKQLLDGGANPKIGRIDPLFLAIYEQNVGALEVMLDHGSSPNATMETDSLYYVSHLLTDDQKRYALLCASFAGKMNTSVEDSTPLLRTLIQRGADLYAPLNDEETLIHVLFQLPEVEVQEILLSESCVSYIDFNRRDQRGRTVLMANCNWEGYLPGYSGCRGDKVTGPPLRMLDLGADPTLIDHEGKTALHHLLNNSNSADEVIKEFIDRKEVAPTLLSKDKQGFTPLHYALRVLRPDICDQLVSKGADLLEPDPNGLTALHHFASNCIQTHRARRSYYSTDPAQVNELFEQSLALWNQFIQKGGSINARDNAGNTPLHHFMASEERQYTNNENIRVCHEIYYDRLFTPDSGVDVQATNNDGETVLHVIAKRPKQDRAYEKKSGHDKTLFQMMMRKELDPLKEDAKGRSALDVASACEKDDIVSIFERK